MVYKTYGLMFRMNTIKVRRTLSLRPSPSPSCLVLSAHKRLPLGPLCSWRPCPRSGGSLTTPPTRPLTGPCRPAPVSANHRQHTPRTQYTVHTQACTNINIDTHSDTGIHIGRNNGVVKVNGIIFHCQGPNIGQTYQRPPNVKLIYFISVHD